MAAHGRGRAGREQSKPLAPGSSGSTLSFAEPDRTSPRLFVESILPLAGIDIQAGELQNILNNPELDNDLALGAALSGFPIILGYNFETVDDGLKQADEKPFLRSTCELT